KAHLPLEQESSACRSSWIMRTAALVQSDAWSGHPFSADNISRKLPPNFTELLFRITHTLQLGACKIRSTQPRATKRHVCQISSSKTGTCQIGILKASRR